LANYNKEFNREKDLEAKFKMLEKNDIKYYNIQNMKSNNYKIQNASDNILSNIKTKDIINSYSNKIHKINNSLSNKDLNDK
jgi:hypothetical protein